jgi:hypothetical protein
MHRLSRCFARNNPIALAILRTSPSSVINNLGQARSPFTATAHTPVSDNESNSLTVRWFEQTASGALKPRESGWDDEAVKYLRGEIAQLEKELKDLENGTGLELLSPEDRAKVEQAKRNALVDGDAPVAEIDLPARYIPSHGDLTIKFELPKDRSLNLRRLNDLLKRAAARISDQRVQDELWQGYARCRSGIPLFFDLVPSGAWEVLWESQYRGSNLNRTEHLKILLQDMREAGKELSQTQKLVFIELLYERGEYENGLQMWMKEKNDLQSNHTTAEYFEDLGVRLFASTGQPQKAEELAIECFRQTHNKRTRMFVPVIQSWLRQGDDQSVKRAWSLYIHLRAKLGRNINLDDYDHLTLGFLKASRIDMALAVFKDMMLMAPGKYSSRDSTAIWGMSLHLLTKEIGSYPLDYSSLTTVSLDALTAIPRRLNNKFFFASWMKRLIGMGEIDAAASVVELMYARGVRPDPKHLNGIIGAWLRTGNKKNREKALQMGWAMVHERLDFVARRHATYGDSRESDVQISDQLKSARTAPPATIETFSLLLLYYGRRSRMEYVEDIKEKLQAAEIPPNSYFMNHLLYAHLRQGDHLRAWKTYHSMALTTIPDLETFACLWDCQKAHFNSLRFYAKDDFPSPRRLFLDMKNWMTKMSHSVETIREGFTRDLYSQIIRCFCLAKDLEGTTVALHALRDMFHYYPDPDAARLVSVQVARMGWDLPKVRGRRRQKEKTLNSMTVRAELAKREKTAIATINNVLGILSEQRAEDLQQQGVDTKQFDAEQRGIENLHLLTEFLRAVLRKTAPDDATVDKAIEKASRTMGAGDLKIESATRQAKEL